MTTIPRFRLKVALPRWGQPGRVPPARLSCVSIWARTRDRGIQGILGFLRFLDYDIPDITETPANSIRKGSFAWRWQGELAYLIELVTAWISGPSRRRAIGVPALNRMLCLPKRMPVPDAPPAPPIRCPSPPRPPPPPLCSPFPPPHASRAHPRPSPGASRLLRAPPHHTCCLRVPGNSHGLGNAPCVLPPFGACDSALARAAPFDSAPYLSHSP